MIEFKIAPQNAWSYDGLNMKSQCTSDRNIFDAAGEIGLCSKIFAHRSEYALTEQLFGMRLK